jgi:ABC-2 type transport system ATP-binding protein
VPEPDVRADTAIGAWREARQVPNVIETRALRKCYGDKVAVDGLDLAIPEGSLTGFLGPNGVGKTTTIRVLLGFLKASSGTAKIFDRDTWTEGPGIREEVGYVPGDLRLYPWFTTRTALTLISRIRRRDLLRAGLELAEDFALDPDVRVSRMSRGTRQKLGIILALAPAPRLLILDEPTTSLDPVMQRRLENRLRYLAASGRTVFFSSHSLGEVERICERVIVLRSGRVVADGTLRDLRAKATRILSVRWAQPVGLELEAPLGVELSVRRAFEWKGILRASSVDVIRWLGSRPVEDVTIGEPDIETLFHDFYRE